MKVMDTRIEREMFEEDPDIRRRVDSLLQAFVAAGRGSTVTWSTAEQLAEESRNSNAGKYIITKSREQLLADYRIATRCRDINHGVYLLKQIEQVVDCGMDRRKKAMRQTRRAIREVNAVSGDELSDHYRMVQAMQVQTLRQEYREINSGLRIVRATYQTTETLPKRPVPSV